MLFSQPSRLCVRFSRSLWLRNVSYSATVQLSETLKGTITTTQVIVDGFGPSSLCKTGISISPDHLLFLVRRSTNSPANTQFDLIYLLSGPIDRAGVFPATESNLSEVRFSVRIWLPKIIRM